MYSPAGFVNKDVTWVKTTEVFDDAGKREVDNAMNSIKTNFIDKGIPVIIGEWSATWKDNADEQAKYAEYTISAAEKIGVKCFYWDNGSADGSKIIERKTGTAFRKGIVDAIMKGLKS